MYIWNGYTVIGKHKDLTEGMLKTLDEAQEKLERSQSMKKKKTLQIEEIEEIYFERCRQPLYLVLAVVSGLDSPVFFCQGMSFL